MKSPVEVIKKNPGKTALAVGVGVVLLIMLRSTSGDDDSGSTVATMGYSESQVAYASQMAQLQAQQTGQNNQLAAQIQGLNIQSQTAIELAQIDKDVRSEELGTQYQIAQMQSFENIRAMETSEEITKYQLSSQLEGLQATLANQLANQSLFVQGQVKLSEISADVSKTSILQGTELARINANENIEMAHINANMQNYAAKKANSSSKASSWAGVAIGLISLFCDVKIKNQIKCVSTADCARAIDLVPLDIWTYIDGSVPASNGDTAEHVGTYAQDFYKALGVSDWDKREKIEVVDMLGVMMGALKETRKERA